MKTYAKALALMSIIFGILCGCSETISNSDLEAQVEKYVNSYKTPVFETKYTDLFSLEGVFVEDKMVSGKTMKAVFTVTSVALKDPVWSDSSPKGGFVKKFAGLSKPPKGSQVSSQLTFQFEKFDSGWRLAGETK